MEKLHVKNMVNFNKNMNREIYDASWSTLRQQIKYKAEKAGVWLLEVDPRNTSKMCNRCGFVKRVLTLNDRIFLCDSCGHEDDRDLNASKNILDKAVRSLEVDKTNQWVKSSLKNTELV